MIPLFDSLAHPTLTGGWLGRDIDAGVEDLIASMCTGGFSHACAVGLAGVEDYSHEAFIRMVAQFDSLIPIAGLDPTVDALADEIQHIKQLGFQGVKIHPRFSGIELTLMRLPELLAAAASVDLPVFFCTYFHTSLDRQPSLVRQQSLVRQPSLVHQPPLDRQQSLDCQPSLDPFAALTEALRRTPEARVVLLHGGDVNLLRYAELVRHNANLLLDLSFTIHKYEGSSIDLDISFLFNKFDERICIGSDFPEFSHEQTRCRFEGFAKGMPQSKIENIAYGNLQRFLRLPSTTSARTTDTSSATHTICYD